MEHKLKVIVLKSIKSGDKDFLVTFFSLEKGVIRAKLRGASSPKAKLKFAKEQFAFLDVILVEKNKFYTVKSADLIDSFYHISQNYEAFLEANQIFKCVLKILPFQQPNQPLFLNVLKALKILCYENLQPNIVLAKFYLQVFFVEGYKISTSTCSTCEQKLGQNVFLDFDSGEVLCFSCKTFYAQKISYEVSKLINLLTQTPFERLSTIKVDQLNLDNTLSVLKLNFEKRF